MTQTQDPTGGSSAFLELLRGRRTVHNFLPGAPPREQVLAALETARWAPNHRLTQPWKFYLVGPEAAEHIALLNADVERAKGGEGAAAAKLKRWRAMPGWLVVTCQKSEDAAREREDYAACCCAVQNFMLALWAGGIGSKWSTGKVLRDPRFLPLIGADAARESCVGLVWFGTPQAVPAPSRRELASFIHECP